MKRLDARARCNFYVLYRISDRAELLTVQFVLIIYDSHRQHVKCILFLYVPSI